MPEFAGVSPETLAEMRDYYRARAAEYDEWFYRKGRYDYGPEANARWFAEAEEAFAAFDALRIAGDVLELAPGTGIWTERLLPGANSITAVDASPEMIAINRAKVNDERVRYIQADLFSWQPARLYDAVVFGFWLSHVPAERLDGFLRQVAEALRPGGTLFFVDGRPEPTLTAHDQALPESGSQLMTRRLNDGRTFQIVKNHYPAAEVEARCAAAGLDVRVHETATFFQYGVGARLA